MAERTAPLDKAREAQKPPTQLDPSLQHFSDPDFDPVDFLNDTLPPLARSTLQSRSTDDRNASSIADLSTRTQSLLSQLNAQNARLSNTLNQLTDEIIRSGGRLAYEVEVLRGETVGLSDTLTETLQDDIRQFLPEGLPELPQQDQSTSDENESGANEEVEDKASTAKTKPDPEYIIQLRTLINVKARLDDVIKVFGDAMEWPLPPSEVSLSSSFISVSAPEPGPESRSHEDKGREVAKKMRSQVTDLLESEGGGEAGLEAAERRVESLQTLAGLWKGTAEEKARFKFVESLAKIVEERRKLLESQAREREAQDHRRGARSPPRLSPSMDYLAREERTRDSSGGGLLRNLQRLRDEIYLE